MFIYIDESGSFAYPKQPRHSYACTGALTIPERRHGAVLKGFKTLRRKWGQLGQEIKGRDLNEGRVAQVIQLLASNDVKFHACVTDLSKYSPESVALRKEEQARQLFANITDKHHPDLVHEIQDAADKIRGMSDQLFLQLCMMMELINAQLHDVMIYFSHKDPSELGSFRWVADRKGREKTTYEELWQNLLPAVIQGRQFSNDFQSKIVFLKDGNYDYCSRFFKTIEKWPDYLPEQSPGLRDKSNIGVVEIGAILKESFTLRDSAEKPGLQLADIATNALRRAMMGNLQPKGWAEIGTLMFRWKDKSVRLMHLAGTQSVQMDDRYAARVVMTITRKAGFVV